MPDNLTQKQKNAAPPPWAVLFQRFLGGSALSTGFPELITSLPGAGADYTKFCFQCNQLKFQITDNPGLFNRKPITDNRKPKTALMAQILGGLITSLLLAIYGRKHRQEKVSIKQVRELRISLQNEARTMENQVPAHYNLNEHKPSPSYAKT